MVITTEEKSSKYVNLSDKRRRGRERNVQDTDNSDEQEWTKIVYYTPDNK